MGSSKLRQDCSTPENPAATTYIGFLEQQGYGGMQWRTIGLLTGIPFTTMYSCFARWNRLGLWKGLVVDLLRRWRVGNRSPASRSTGDRNREVVPVGSGAGESVGDV